MERQVDRKREESGSISRETAKRRTRGTWRKVTEDITDKVSERERE